ncbi:uncharacterized protein LOC132755856 [Ruditapes philippinarum]|uniref:uncharacterized protein LOC132755856 n=1 Tax=Ruditapes philippinarum TaxID=129788 RepID=UPI00295C1001|nr:uncharacterized protein LOC132755856 [Ruditapes philippinarum]
MSIFFNSRLPQTIPSLKIGEQIKFIADVNEGKAYNEKTGIFTTKEDGYYKFAFTIGCSGTKENVAANLVVTKKTKTHDTIVASAATDISRPSDPLICSQASNSSIVWMASGDKAKVVISQKEAQKIAGDGVSTFSGYKL